MDHNYIAAIVLQIITTAVHTVTIFAPEWSLFDFRTFETKYGLFYLCSSTTGHCVTYKQYTSEGLTEEYGHRRVLTKPSMMAMLWGTAAVALAGWACNSLALILLAVYGWYRRGEGKLTGAMGLSVLADKGDGLMVDGISVGTATYANDTALLSLSKAGLDQMLGRIHLYAWKVVWKSLVREAVGDHYRSYRGWRRKEMPAAFFGCTVLSGLSICMEQQRLSTKTGRGSMN